MGIVFDIQRMSLQDGPGIRTSIFLKGCPLNCLWCHNQESKKYAPELFYKPEKCIHCGCCARVCKLHTFENGAHVFQRRECTDCFRCADVCPAGALERIGKEMSVQEVMDIVMRDTAFYEASGGGVTLTGGEPLFQFEFTLALAGACKRQGLHVCVDTSGYTFEPHLEKLVEYTDLFLFDIKETDTERHRRFTGVGNDRILYNLRYLDALGARTILRCPIIPGYNDRSAHFKKIAELANTLKHVQQINIVPYHPLGQKKCEWLGQPYMVGDLPMPDRAQIDEWVAAISSQTSYPVSMV